VIAYIDSSVLMRIILVQASPLAEWGDLQRGVSSELLVLEGFRTFDRLWHNDELTEADLAEKRPIFRRFVRRLDLRPLERAVLHLAARSLPTSLAALDAIHLATAIRYRAAQPPDERPLLFATHDTQLARAARAINFEVIGA
jgi:predicted nucleic acid-binding protein